jgi:outer membrane receptor for ferrienterochelin and colicins
MSRSHQMNWGAYASPLLIAACVSLAPSTRLAAQAAIAVHGRVVDHATGQPLAKVSVTVAGRTTASTNDAGAFTIVGAPTASFVISVRRIGYRAADTTVTPADALHSIDIALVEAPVSLGEVRVTAASRQPERIVDAPAAIAVVDPAYARDMKPTGQLPLLVANLPGVHVLQSGVYDFNINARGFNSALSRNVIVLVDGRDVSVPLLGNQDWADVAILGDDVSVEMVRGPGSALYGANAMSGVLAINSPALRAAHDSRLSVTGGGLSTLRTDGSAARLSSDGRFGFRATGGYARSSTWDVSRTNTGDLQREYADAGGDASNVHAPAPGFELLPLNGQTKNGSALAPSPALGTPDPVTLAYGSLRGDYYPSNGSTVTLEGGDSRIENPVNTTGIGRSQVLRAERPWARAAWTGDGFSLMSYYSGRDGHQVSLGSGAPANDVDAIVHTEGQFNRHFADARGRIVLGGSARTVSVNSRGTLLDAQDDGRTDAFYAAFGQVDYALTDMLRIVGAGRVDASTLDAAQVSPKVALVLEPRPNQSFRVSYSSGFRAPSTFERFLNFPAGPPIALGALEQALRASALGPALAAVPNGTLFSGNDAVPLLAIGNRHLRPQEEKSWEAGYKTELGRWYVTSDAYFSRIDRFVSGLLTGVNPDYRAWTAPAAVPAASRAALEGAVAAAVGGLTRLSNGTSAYVVSYGNEGHATEWGAELAGGVAITSTLAADANYSFHRWALERATLFAADTVTSNTPRHTVNAGLQYHAASGLRLHVGFQYNDAFFFHDYQWTGGVPVSHTVDVTASRPIANDLTLGLAATNALDERRYQLFGGSVIGRRVLVTMTWRP